MKHLSTAYLTFPDDLDRSIRDIYADVNSLWENFRKFDFIPMIPIWKVIVSEDHEAAILDNLSKLKLEEISKLRIKGFESRPHTGYIILVFDDESSKNLEGLSLQVKSAMSVGDFETQMPYGFEPHMSLIKQDPGAVNEILSSLPKTLNDTEFSPNKLVISKEMGEQFSYDFKVIWSHNINGDAGYLTHTHFLPKNRKTPKTSRQLV